MKVFDPDAPLTPEERAELNRVCNVLWVSAIASQKIEGENVPKEMARPDGVVELTYREARRLIYPETHF